MPDLQSLLITTLLISSTGAFTPGPLTIATVIVGSKGGLKEGLKIAFGHVAFEFPYVMALVVFLGLVKHVLETRLVKSCLALAISAFTIYFAYLAIKDGIRIARYGLHISRPIAKLPSFVIGLLYTGLNPHFLIWWSTIGLTIVIQIVSIGLHVLPLVYLTHVTLDFTWLSLMAYLSKRGFKALGRKYGYFIASLGLFLVALTTWILIDVFLE